MSKNVGEYGQRKQLRSQIMSVFVQRDAKRSNKINKDV